MTMKHIPFLVVLALMFLPTQVEGTVLFGFVIAVTVWDYYKTFLNSPRLIKRDCNALLRSAGVTDTERCECTPNLDAPTFNAPTLYSTCVSMKESICLSPSDPAYCTNASIGLFSTFSVNSGARKLLVGPGISSAAVTFYNYYNSIQIQFFSDVIGGSTGSSLRFAGCTVALSLSSGSVPCQTCVICDNGVDFKYDCSNRGGPNEMTCRPVTDVFPSF